MFLMIYRKLPNPTHVYFTDSMFFKRKTKQNFFFEIIIFVISFGKCLIWRGISATQKLFSCYFSLKKNSI